MLLHDAPSTSTFQIRPERLRVCPQCDEFVLAPLMAEHVSARHVRNHWVCESCGHAFRQSFKFEADLAA